MKRGTRITLLTLLVVLAAIVAVDGGVNAVLSRMVSRRVNRVLATLPDCQASCGEVQVGLFTGTAELNDLHFAYRSDSTSHAPGAEIYIETVEAGRLFFTMLFDKKVLIHTVRLVRPSVELWMDEEHPETCFPAVKTDTAVLKLIFPMVRAELMNLHLEEASFKLHSTRTPLDIEADECSLSMYELMYDSTFSCDSVFQFSLPRASAMLMDGRTRISTRHISFRNQEKLVIGPSRYTNTLPQHDGLPAADIRVDRIEIGPVSHSAFLRKQLELEAVSVVNPRVELWMDETNPKQSFKTLPAKPNAKQLSMPFSRTMLKRFQIKNVCFAMHSTRTPLDVAADSCTLTMQRLVYDGRFHCDSVFRFSLEYAKVLFPDGRMRLETRDIAHRDQLGLSVGPTCFSYLPDEADRGKQPGSEIQAERLMVSLPSLAKLLDGQVLVEAIRVVRPRVEMWMDEEHPELCFTAGTPKEPKESKLKARLQSKEEPLFSLMALNHLSVEDASFALHSTISPMDVVADSFSVSAHLLAYDTAFHCDSTVRFSLAHANLTLPDGRMRMEINQVRQDEAGVLSTGLMRVAHTMPKLQLGDIVQEPTTWIDMRVESVKTSPFDLLQMFLSRNYTLDKAEVVVAQMDMLRDLRYKPKKPFLMPQQAFLAIEPVFLIREVDARIKQMNIELTSTDINCGSLQLANMTGHVENITNRKGATMTARGLCPFETGKANMEMTMTMNEDCDFSMSMQAATINVSFLNTLIRPLVGMTCEMQIDTFDTRFSGDKLNATGSFKLLYHGFDAKVHKEDDIPYKIVTKHATAINVAANTLIPKSNPLTTHGIPKAYNVKWKRDEWTPTGLYLFGPCIDGVIKTLLPGLFIKERIREKKTKKQEA